MSCNAIGKVFALDKSKIDDPNELLVLLSLAWHDFNGCFPTDETIMHDCGIRGRATVWKYRKKLIEHGFLEADLSRKTKRGHGYKYRLLLDDDGRQPSSATHSDCVQTVEHNTSNNVQTVEHNAATITFKKHAQNVQQYVQQSVQALEHDSRIVDSLDSVCVEQHTLREIDLESEIQALASKGVPRSFSRHCIERWNADGGKACKVPITKSNFVNRVEAWWGTEHHQERYLDQQPAVTQKPIPCSWELCEERCANFQGGRCICGMKVSPESNPSRPYPPNECPRFKDITERECA